MRYDRRINVFRAAASRYQLDVIQKSRDENGFIRNLQLVQDWVDDALGDGDYNVRGALDIIEGMITGVQGITRSPSVYELAMNRGACSEDLLEFVNSLIMEGSTLAFIAMEYRGDGVHQADKDQLAARLKMNREKFLSGCSYYEKTSSVLTYWGYWGDWGSTEYCPDHGYAVAFKQRVEANQGRGDDTALNSICLICNTGKEVCSKTGLFGSWASSSNCKQGFYASDFKFEGNQGRGDDSAANELKLKCRDGSWKTTGNGGPWGSWQGYKYCPSAHVICGIQTRVERNLGNGKDDSALNGVELVCCKDKWN